MKPTPILSIIIPVYNIRKWLPACIESILSQTFTDWELLVIDDGSTDGSEAICEAYSSQDSRIKTFHKTNGGVSAARNYGLTLAQGEFITFIDGDDELGTLTTLEENLQLLIDNSDIDIVQFPWQSVRNNRVRNKRLPKDKTISTEIDKITNLCYSKITYQVWQKIYRASLLKSIHFPEDIRIGEDVIFMINVLKKARTVYLSGKGLYRYNIRETSAMRTIDANGRYDEFRISYYLFMELCRTEGVSESVKTYYFFIVFERLCRVQATGKYNLQTQFNELKSFIPDLSLGRLFRKMKKHHKNYLIQVKLFGGDYLYRNLTEHLQKQTIA